jgi:membrane fusion protein (multidrug efflux system)
MRNITGIFIIVTCFFISCKSKTDESQSSKTLSAPPVVDVVVANMQTIDDIIDANGTVVANEYVELHPEASGRLTYIDVPEGKFISAGTIIARVNDADLKAQIEKSKVQLDLAQKTEDRYKKLLAVNGINQSDYDASLNTVNGYKADIDYNQALLDKTVLRAPFSGIMGLRQVSLGAYVSPTTLIATLQQLEKIKIDFTLPEVYDAVLKKGALVDVELDAIKKIHAKAEIIAVEPQVNQNSRNLTVRAILQNTKANPGTFVKVSINAGVNKKAIMIPTNSLIPDDKNNQAIVVKDGKAVFVNVKTGVRKANNVEITSGISAGDTVVVTGVLFARAKNPVSIRSVKTLEEFAALNNNTNNE